MRWTIAIAMLCGGAALAEGDAGTAVQNTLQYEAEHQFECNGPLEPLPQPDVREYGGHRYTYNGGTVSVERIEKRKGSEIRIGVIAGIKDLEKETEASLTGFFEQFEKRDVELVLIGGDTAETPEDLEKIYTWLTDHSMRPMIAIVGNTERAGAHNYAISKQRSVRGKLNLLNGSIARRFDGDGFDVVSLGGYFDKKYLHQNGGCLYKEADLAVVEAAAKQAGKDPVIFLSHGPPHQTGDDAIDFVPNAGNVGDPALTELLKRAGINFGVHGHIIEAGGTATDFKGKTVKPGAFAKKLFLNPGSASSLPWKLNSGPTSYGLAAVLTLKGKTAKYEILKAPKRESKAE
jgi:Icc-related predicted phosphoesterase